MHCIDIHTTAVWFIVSIKYLGQYRVTVFNTVLHVVYRFVRDHSFFTQYSYYRDFFCLGSASRLRDWHRHVWVRYTNTTKITVWCISSILIYMTYFSVYTIHISEIYWSIVSYSTTTSQQVSAILWNITRTFLFLCEIVQFLLNTVIIMNYFVLGQHRVFMVAIVMF